MPELKLHRHEKFARAYVRLDNAAAAYREVYKPAKNRTAKVNGWELLNRRGGIKARVKELRVQMAKRADITEDKILTDYQTALSLAVAKDDPNAIVNAATAQAKLVGLLRDRVETGEVGDFDNMNTLSEVLEAVKDLVSPEAALALAQAFKVAVAPPEGQLEASHIKPIPEPETDTVN